MGPGAFQPIYDDALGVGLAVQSTDTGKVTTFQVGEAEEDDGDIVRWVLTPISTDRGMTDVKVIIYND